MSDGYASGKLGKYQVKTAGTSAGVPSESATDVAATAVPESERDRRGALALDQWRGLALILVLVSHGFYFTDRVHGIGRVGVHLFFFISGILVFRSLSHSRAKDSWERTRSFWWRRLRRLHPALASYVLVMLATTWWLQRMPNLLSASDFRSMATTAWAAFAYVINYVPNAPIALAHLWSLACEMQFYILAPLIYMAGGAGDTRRHLVFGGVLVILTGLGLAQPLIREGKYHFEFAAWPMMLGFFCEYQRAWFRRVPEGLVRVILWLSLAVGGVTLCLMLFGYKSKLMVIGAGTLLLAPCWLAYVHGRPMAGLPGCWMRWSGERTYSVYLWQQPLTICGFLPALWHPTGAAASLVLGAVCFRMFEFPFLSANRRTQEISR